jgi:hypothetical protein
MNRRRMLTTALIGGAGAFLVVGAANAGVFGNSANTAGPGDTNAVEPFGGAGIFDVDPDQSGVNQDPNAVVTGNATALPVDWGF